MNRVMHLPIKSSLLLLSIVVPTQQHEHTLPEYVQPRPLLFHNGHAPPSEDRTPLRQWPSPVPTHFSARPLF